MSKLDKKQHLRIRYLEYTYPEIECTDEVAEQLALNLYIMRFEPDSERGKQLWAEDSAQEPTWSAEAPDARAIDPRAQSLREFREIMNEDIPDWDELFDRAGIRGQDYGASVRRTQTTNAGHRNASNVSNNNAQQGNAVVRSQSNATTQPTSTTNANRRNDSSRPQGRGRNDQAAPAAQGPLYNAYANNDDLDWDGGEQLRTVYCGLDPEKKPKRAVWGNRLQCLRKGYMARKAKVTAW